MEPLEPARHVPTRRTWRQRFGEASVGTKIAIVLGVSVLSCGLCICSTFGGLAVLANVLPPAPTDTASSTRVVLAQSPTADMTSPALTPTVAIANSPTAEGASTATPAPTRPIVTGATFGGPDGAFQTKYGHTADDLWDVNGVTFSTNLDSGVDGQQHVFGMLVYKSDTTTWTQAQAQPICRAFLPPDAVHTGNKQDGSGNLVEVYTSTRLGATFPPAAKVGYDPSGTLRIDYEIANGGIFQCSIDNFA